MIIFTTNQTTITVAEDATCHMDDETHLVYDNLALILDELGIDHQAFVAGQPAAHAAAAAVLLSVQP